MLAARGPPRMVPMLASWPFAYPNATHVLVSSIIYLRGRVEYCVLDLSRNWVGDAARRQDANSGTAGNARLRRAVLGPSARVVLFRSRGGLVKAEAWRNGPCPAGTTPTGAPQGGLGVRGSGVGGARCGWTGECPDFVPEGRGCALPSGMAGGISPTRGSTAEPLPAAARAASRRPFRRSRRRHRATGWSARR